MINRKRLIMMTVAASMMLPTNLAYLSVITPVLAADENEGTGDLSTESKNEPILLSKAADVPTDTDNMPILEDGKTYKLTDSIELSTYLTIPADTKAVIDLNGKTLSCPKTCLYMLANSSLEIIGDGSITSTDAEFTNTLSMIILAGEKAQLNIGPGVKVTSNNTKAEFVDAVNIGNSAKNAVVNLTGVEITAHRGVYVNGLMPADDAPIVNLTRVKITASDTGIYQAGSSTFNVVNCTIKGVIVGIETRAGTLNVSGGTIEGGKETEILTPNSNGSTSSNVGIAIAQHSSSKLTPPCPVIDVNISGKANVSGGAALLIADPQGNVDKESEKDEFNKGLYKKISVVVADSTLKGTKHDVAYTTDKIGFTLIGNGLDSLNIKKCTVTDSKLDDGEKVENPTNITLIPKDTSSTADTTTSIKMDTLPNGVDSITDNKLTPEQKQKVEEELKSKLEESAKAAFTPITSEDGTAATEPQTLKYTYKVTVNPEVAELPNGSYSVQAKLEAVLDNTSEDSVVRLYIPRHQQQSAEIMSETATTTDGNYDPGFALDATLSAVADMDTGKFKAEKIKKILKTLPEAANFDEKAVDKFDYVTFTGNHVVADTETPVVFTVEQAVYPNTNSGGSHKPKPKPEEPMEEPVVGIPTTMYRLYNKLTGEHLYTIDKNERDNLLTSDTWSDEGEGWIAPSESPYPVYRLLNPNNSDHHYTMDKNEFDTLPSYGWIAEGIAFFSADKDNPENVILHRLYNPNAEGAGSHHYTADTNERDTLVAKGWTYEGLAWAGLPESK